MSSNSVDVAFGHQPSAFSLQPSALSNETERRARIAAALERLAAAHVLFPAAIVTISVSGFVVGHRMDGWVLPVAAVITLALLRLLSDSWRHAALIVLLATVLHIAAGFGAVALPDGSWDGLAYHQEAVLRLAAGWNPLVEDAAAYGRGSEIYLNHYPKGPWITAAAVLLSTGHVEAGKLFNLTLMIAAGALVTSALLRLTSLRIPAAAALGTLTALNPVVIYQSTTFYIDGALGSLITVLVAGLAVFVVLAQWQALGVALVAACLLINLKFTGLVYAAVLLALAVPIVWRWHGLRAAYGMAAAAAVAGTVGVLFLGYAPYVRNLRERGAPFYPISPPPAHRPDYLIFQRPVNLTDSDRFTRFLVSNLSRSEAVRPPLGTRLKFPLSIGAEERRGVYGADPESGGFGPLYGALLLLAGVGAIALTAHPSTRKSAGLVLLTAGCVLVSIFVHSETWWARFVPQAWLLPILVAAASLCSPRRSLRWWLGGGLVALASANLLIVGANVGWRQLVYARDTQRSLREMAMAHEPVTVYLRPFMSLRQRLLEAGVDFRMVETRPESHHVHRAIPTPGNQAFWFEAR